MKRGGVFLGILAFPPGIAVGVTFVAGVNLYYDFHPVYFLGTAVAQWHGYPDIAAAARRHGAVLRTLPVYPGARLTSTDTGGRGGSDKDFAEGFINQPTEILTTWTWRLPPGATTQAVADWYELRVRHTGWHVNRDDVDADVLLAASRDKPRIRGSTRRAARGRRLCRAVDPDLSKPSETASGRSHGDRRAVGDPRNRDGTTVCSQSGMGGNRHCAKPRGRRSRYRRCAQPLLTRP